MFSVGCAGAPWDCLGLLYLGCGFKVGVLGALISVVI